MKFKPGARLDQKEITDIRPEQARQRELAARRTEAMFRRYGYEKHVSGDSVTWVKPT